MKILKICFLLSFMMFNPAFAGGGQDVGYRVVESYKSVGFELVPYQQIGADVKELFPPKANIWQAKKGQNLRQAIESWNERSKWNLVWNSDYEYPIYADAVFTGDYITAVTTFLKSISNVRPSVKAQFYKGNKVLVIETSAGDTAG